MEKQPQRTQWFMERIGKRIFRNKFGQSCRLLAAVYRTGLVVMDSLQAYHLAQAEGPALRYFDTKKDVVDFERKIGKSLSDRGGKKGKSS